ncbi:MAG: T9SS type A sorting domain-containing protein [Chitinophagales bacterium]
MRKFTLLTVFSTLALFTLLFVVPNHETAEEDEGGNGKGLTEAQVAAGSLDWWNNLRSSGETGFHNPKDFYKALEQAEALGTSRDVPSIEWVENGPDNIGGRTRAVIFDKLHPGVVFAGGVSGGLWRSENNGDSWTRVQGDFSLNTVSCIAQASNGDIYFGTGEAFYDLSLNIPTSYSAMGYPGQGIWKSTDGGASWSHLEATKPVSYGYSLAWDYVNKIACSPTDPNRIYAAINKGLKISTDGGASWYDATGTNQITYSWDVKIASDGYVYVINGNNYYRSDNPDGDVFTNLQGQGGFATTGKGRTELAVGGVNNPEYVYAVVGEPGLSGGLAGIYKSTDHGLNWTLIGPGNSVTFNPLGQQAFYNITCAVLPSNPDVLFVGGQLSLYKYTTDLGWYTVSNWLGFFFDLSIYIHADMHTIAFNPANPDQFILGCDGGVFRTNNASQTYPTFQSVNRNYNVTQAYSVAAKTTGEVLMGCQDNGTQYIDFLGNTNMASHDVSGGDGFDVAISWTNPSAFFEEYYSGQLTRSSNNGIAFSSFFDFRIDGGTQDGAPDEGADWIAPFSLWEANDSSYSFFVLGTGLSSGHAWLTTGALNFAINPDWFQMPATDGPVTCTAFSADGDNLYVGTSKGTVYRYGNLQQVYAENKFTYASISSAASTWHAADSGVIIRSKNVGTGRYLRSIYVDPHNPSHVVVTAARYGYTSYVWQSNNATDSLITFDDITGDLPYMPVWSSCIDYVNPNLILVGTDLGVYARDMTTGGWVEQNQGMDRVPVLQIIQIPYYGQYSYTYIGTYGRGVFHSSTTVGINEVQSNLINGLSVYPNPVKDQASVNIAMMQSGDLTISVYDLRGQRIFTKKEQKVTSGNHQYPIPVSNFESGTYIVNASSGSSSSSVKMMVIK